MPKLVRSMNTELEEGAIFDMRCQVIEGVDENKDNFIELSELREVLTVYMLLMLIGIYIRVLRELMHWELRILPGNIMWTPQEY